MAKTKWTAKEVCAAIEGTGGIKTSIAQKLNVSRMTVDRYLDRWVTVREAYEQEKSRIDDMVVHTLISAIKEGNLSIAKWWATMKMSDEFSDRKQLEHSGPEGGPIELEGQFKKALEAAYGKD